MSGKFVRVEKNWKNVQINYRRQSAYLCPRPASSVGRALDFGSNGQGFESPVARKLSFVMELEAGKYENS